MIKKTLLVVGLVSLFLFVGVANVHALEVWETEFSGNGVDNRLISHDLSGIPDYCQVGDVGTQDVIFKTTDHAINDSHSWREDTVISQQGFESLNATSVTIDDNSHINGSGVDYLMTCIKFAGDGDGEVGTYTGNGSDNREISLSSVTAVRWFGTRSATSTGAHGFKAATTTDQSYPWHEFGAPRSNEVQSLGTSTVTIGTASAVNTNGDTYFYIAIGTDDGVCDGLRAGDGVDDTDVTDCGWDPEFVLVQSHSNTNGEEAVSKGDSGTGEETMGYSFVAHYTTDAIQNVSGGGNGFQVGTHDSVNDSGNQYLFFALRDTPAPAATRNRFILIE